MAIYIFSAWDTSWYVALARARPLLISVIMIPLFPKDLIKRIILEINDSTWVTSTKYLGTFWYKDYIASIFMSSHPVVFFNFYQVFALSFIVLGGYLVINSARIDWRLGIYAIIIFTVIILFGFINGLPRYIPFIFPMWLVIKNEESSSLGCIDISFLHSFLNSMV